MNEQRFRELDQAWERSQEPINEWPSDEEIGRREHFGRYDELYDEPADYPPMADDPQSMTGGEE